MIESNLTTYITLVTTSGVLSAFLSLYAFFRRKNIPGAHNLILLTALQSIYIFAFAFELASDSLEEIKRWVIVEYIGIAFAPVLGLKLVLRYIGRTPSRLVSYLLFVIPTITLLLVATNDSHGLFYKSIYLRPDTPTPMADVVVGQWYIVHGAFTFGCLLAGAALLIRQWSKTQKSYRMQLVTLICGQIIPMVAAFLYLMGLTPGGMDPVPFVLFITAAMYSWAILSKGMLTIVPIAKERIFESMQEGVLVLDPEERLIDYNAAMRKMLPTINTALFGKPLDDMWNLLNGEPFPVKRRNEGEGILDTINWISNGQLFHYEVRSSVVRGRNGEQVGSLLMFIDATEQKRLQEQLQQMAYFDGLTGIYNRIQFIQRSRMLLEKSRLQQLPLSIVLFDIDRFKRFNDTYGHETGDQVILHVVAVCQTLIAKHMLFARYGGEEFVIVLPETPLNDAVAFAERLRIQLEEQPFATEAAPLPLPVTASFGVSGLTPGCDSIEAMLRDADAALYESKRTGRNRVSSAAASAEQMC